MSETIETRALLLRRVAYGDADWIATLLCREHGKISVLARSARRSKRRFAGALTWFSVSDVEIKKVANRELQNLTAATLRESYQGIAADAWAFAQGSYAIEVIRELTTTEADAELFDLLVDLFRSLQTHGANVAVLRSFELHALRAAGFSPVLSRCVACDGPTASGTVLDVARGGALCRSCAPHARDRGVRVVSEAALAALDTLSRTPDLASAAELSLPADVLGEVRGALLSLVGHCIGKPLKTLDFVSKLKKPKVRLRHHEGDERDDRGEFEHDDPQ